ncbi:hypothetical protein [Streptomyces caelestis]|uniref:hypothetical protein n=1 Tax=Streptomyces caelestis TaxID=36816 RepID=UPI003654B220
MITHADEGPEFDPDDPLAVVLRPGSDHLGPPPGRFEEIRRGAARRRLVRAAVGVGAGLACAVAALVVLPPQSSPSDGPVSPAVPLAPPPVSSPSATPTPSASPEPAEPHATPTEARPAPTEPHSTPTEARPTPQAPTDGPESPAGEVAPVPDPR